MGAALRKADDSPSSHNHPNNSTPNENQSNDDVTAFTPEGETTSQRTTTAADQLSAEAANQRLKEKKLKEKQNQHPHHESQDPSAPKQSNPNNHRRPSHATNPPTAATHANKKSSSNGEVVWNKPPAAVVVAAALKDEESDDVETIAMPQSCANVSLPAGSSDSDSHRSPHSHPPLTSRLVNPWARPGALFVRNFEEESADAELFVQLARDRTKKELKAQKKRQSSIVVHSHQDQSNMNHQSPETIKPKHGLDEEEHTHRGEEEDEEGLDNEEFD